MISVDTMEVLLRSIPQYFLFAALGLLIFSWINKKPRYSLLAEVVLIVAAILSLYVLLSGYIPSPKTRGMNEEQLKTVINMLLFILTVGFLALISILIRLLRKKMFSPLVVAIFVLTLVLFFQSTKLSRIKFELNRPTEIVTDTIK